MSSVVYMVKWLNQSPKSDLTKQSLSFLCNNLIESWVSLQTLWCLKRSKIHFHFLWLEKSRFQAWVATGGAWDFQNCFSIAIVFWTKTECTLIVIVKRDNYKTRLGDRKSGFYCHLLYRFITWEGNYLKSLPSWLLLLGSITNLKINSWEPKGQYAIFETFASAY